MKSLLASLESTTDNLENEFTKYQENWESFYRANDSLHTAYEVNLGGIILSLISGSISGTEARAMWKSLEEDFANRKRLLKEDKFLGMEGSNGTEILSDESR